MTYAVMNTVSSLSQQAHRLANYFVNHRHDAEDIAQEALTRLYERPERLAAARHSQQYLAAAVKNTACDFFRSRTKRATVIHPTISYNQVTGEAEVNEDTITYLPIHAEEVSDISMEQLHNALLQLSNNHRQALMLFAAGMSYEEIAQTQKVSIGTVRSRINAARRKLQSLLGIER